LSKMVDAGTINQTIAKKVLKIMWDDNKKRFYERLNEQTRSGD
jgi:hypothetical protein